MLPISVIIVTHNHARYLQRCLDALLPQVKQLGGEVIVIDNLSDDDSLKIANSYPNVQLYLNPERRGFAANNNFGMAVAQGRYILLLNPDTEVLPGAIKTLMQFMDEHPNVGLSGAQLLFPDGTIQPSPRRFPTWGSVLARRTPLRIFMRNSRFNRRHLMLDLDHTQPFPVDWLLGACLLIRREVLETVGPLDEGFFLYVEDIDWARRIHQRGWQVYYVPTAQIIHHHLAVSDKHFFSYRMWLHFQSMIRYACKYLLPKLPLISLKDNQTKIWKTTHQQIPINHP